MKITGSAIISTSQTDLCNGGECFQVLLDLTRWEFLLHLTRINTHKAVSIQHQVPGADNLFSFAVFRVVGTNQLSVCPLSDEGRAIRPTNEITILLMFTREHPRVWPKGGGKCEGGGEYSKLFSLPLFKLASSSTSVSPSLLGA